MQLNNDTIPMAFEIANPSNSHYTTSINTYDYIDRGQRTLCVTIGESWTWGADLDDRLNDVYGNHLSLMLGANWLNLGLPGIGNHFMASKVVELARANLEYDDIYVFCTFTELGRQLNSQFDQHINFLDWKKNYLGLGFDQFLLMLNEDCIKIIDNNSTNFTRTIIGTNWVDSLGFSSETWLKLLVDYDDICYSSMHGLTRLIKEVPKVLELNHCEMLRFKDWTCNLIDKSVCRNKIMEKSKLFKNYHPWHKESHMLWAKYLFNQI